MRIVSRSHGSRSGVSVASSAPHPPVPIIARSPFPDRPLGRHAAAWLTALTWASALCGGGCAGAGAGEPGAGAGGGASGTGGVASDTGGSSAGSGGESGGGGGGTGGAISGSGGTSPTGSGGARTGSGGRTGSGSGGGMSSGGSGAGSGGRGSGGAASATGGSSGTNGSSAATPTCTWPTPVGSDELVTATKPVSGSFDGGMKRFVGSGALGTSGQAENQGPLFDLANGATLKNVILGNPAADGVHCAGTCTLINVWWEDVGEDAATLKGSSATQVMTIDGGGANHASDKIFQHNGPGTMIIKNFCAQDFGKLYRSCGNCTTQYTRHAQFENLMLIPHAGSVVAGVNSNYNDTATFKAITVKAAANSITICQRYTGNNTGAEPTKNGAGADGTVCVYAPTDIIWQ